MIAYVLKYENGFYLDNYGGSVPLRDARTFNSQEDATTHRKQFSSLKKITIVKVRIDEITE